MSYRIKTQAKSTPPNEVELLNGLERLGVFLQENRVKVLAGVGVLLAAAAVLVLVTWLSHRSSEHAQELERQATQLYVDRPLDKPEQADKNLKEAITLYRQLLDQYPKTPSAQLALFHLGNALAQANEMTGAMEAYQKYVSAYPDNKMLLGLVLQRLAYAQLSKGDVDGAVKSFTVALEAAGTMNKDQILYELGKLEESRSHPEGALARYQELTKSYPNSPFTGEAAVRTKALETKALPAPSPESSATPPPSAAPGSGK
ncbi:MAG TPA: tetratricopeptide repeat protein [Nitrospiraceae bacterium]|nr:tetratricopeptide repeat protein [Nitrospiraceae bacterium]